MNLSGTVNLASLIGIIIYLIWIPVAVAAVMQIRFLLVAVKKEQLQLYLQLFCNLSTFLPVYLACR